MNPISEDMKDLLIQEGVGEFASKKDWGIYVFEEPPEEPDRCVTLFDDTSAETGYHNKEYSSFVSGFQVRVRARTYLEGKDKIWEIRKLLHRRLNFKVNDQGYGAVMARGGEPLPLSKDDKERFIWVQGFVGHRKG